ncbi:hypothetical protein SRHO_G00184180 [Serrasalmus rhombeus]
MKCREWENELHRIESDPEQPRVKSLEKICDYSLKDATSIQEISKELEALYTKMDKTGLLGKFKALIYQHPILPWTLWPLLVCAVSMMTVKALERSHESKLAAT